ncbi:MAG: hypothetical protein PHR35_01215 [Kiritimatiellae bacterium]|nr:hypothetical protein [Kiritimatiellia bacterium]
MTMNVEPTAQLALDVVWLAGSSSIAPGVPWKNLEAMVEGLRRYRDRGRERT